MITQEEREEWKGYAEAVLADFEVDPPGIWSPRLVADQKKIAALFSALEAAEARADQAEAERDVLLDALAELAEELPCSALGWNCLASHEGACVFQENRECWADWAKAMARKRGEEYRDQTVSSDRRPSLQDD